MSFCGQYVHAFLNSTWHCSPVMIAKVTQHQSTQLKVAYFKCSVATAHKVPSETTDEGFEDLAHLINGYFNQNSVLRDSEALKNEE